MLTVPLLLLFAILSTTPSRQPGMDRRHLLVDLFLAIQMGLAADSRRFSPDRPKEELAERNRMGEKLVSLLWFLIKNDGNPDALQHLPLWQLNDTQAREEQLRVALELLYTHVETSSSVPDESYRAVEISRILCNMLADITPPTTHFCPYHFDMITCWPATPVGSEAIRPCPTYVAWARTEGR